MLYLVPVFSSIKKVQKKRELRKVVKEKLKISWFMCTSAKSFLHIKWVTSLLSLFGANLVGSDRNTCIPIILLVCIKSEISLRVCLTYLHHSYPMVGTRQRTSSLDCYLTLQQLDFRFPCVSLPTKLHLQAIVIGTLWSCIRLAITFVTTTCYFSCNP